MQVKIFFLLLSGLALLAPKANSQSVLAGGGGAATNGQLQVAWTLGEPIIQTAGPVTQGFHSPEVQVLSRTKSVAIPSLVQAFPNPVEHTLTLQFNGTTSRTAVQAVIWNVLAQQMLAVDIPIGTADYALDCTVLVPGMYWLLLRKKDGSPLATMQFTKN